jgi:predicted enzyme related to lactoylglutathione lyase
MLKVGSIVIRVEDLERQAQFWQEALGYERRADDSEVFAHLYPSDGEGPNVALDALRSEVQVPPRIHIDLYSDDREAEVQRLIGLGAAEIPWDNRPPEADYVVMADPEGNRFCVIDAPS